MGNTHIDWENKDPYFKGERLIFDLGKCLDLYIIEKYLIELSIRPSDIWLAQVIVP